MEYPLISVIVPTHNDASTIEVALQSILSQTYSNLEIIVVDDHSTDTTAEAVKALAKKHKNLHYYLLPWNDPHRYNRKGVNINAGYLARNYGFTKAKGEWITFQDSDDASFKNRIEVQYQLAQEHDSNHVSIDWQKFEEKFIGKELDIEKFLRKPHAITKADELYQLSQETKGSLAKLVGRAQQHIPFWIKNRHFIRDLFFKKWTPYPCAGNSTLFKADLLKTCQFRPLWKREWPSQKGRGADRDFNFQLAEQGKKSICAKIPLYLWRVTNQNAHYQKND